MNYCTDYEVKSTLCMIFFFYLINAPTDMKTISLLLTACDFKQHFVIEAQSELRHPRQDHFELNAAHYFTAQDAAVGAHLREEKHCELYEILSHSWDVIFTV